jgi:hypothetical protein
MKPKDPLDEWSVLLPKAGAPSRKSILLLALKRGLIWTVISMTVLVVSFGVYCGLFGYHPTPIYGSYEPGWNAAFTGAILFLFLGGPTFGLGIFVTVFVVSLVRSLRASA